MRSTGEEMWHRRKKKTGRSGTGECEMKAETGATLDTAA